MALEIFWGSGSFYSWRVLLGLEVKRLPYESRLIQFSTGEHKTPAFLAMNPRGRVPVLRDGDYVVYESLACLAYLDRKYPETPLFGATAEEAGRIWRSVSETISEIDEAADNVILPLYRGKAREHEAAIREAAPGVVAEVGRLDTELASGPWLASSPRISAADIVAYPVLRSLVRAAEKPDAALFDLPFAQMAAKWPAVAGWMARIEGLPGYERTFPPHWRG